MSLTLRTSTAEARRRFGRQTIVVAAGLIIAVSSLATLAFWHSDKVAPPAGTGKTSIVFSPQQDDTVKDFIYYLVDSEEQRSSVLTYEASLAREAQSRGLTTPKRYIEVYVAPSAAEVHAVSEAIVEIPQFGNGAQLVDWRSR